MPPAGLRLAGEAAFLVADLPTEFDGPARESFRLLLAAQREPVAAP